MKQLEKLFGDHNIIMYVEKGITYFEIQSVSMAIGYVTKAKGKEYPHKTRINKTLKMPELNRLYTVYNFLCQKVNCIVS